MKSLLVAALCAAVPIAAAGQTRAPQAAARPGEAYEQFLLAHRLAEQDDEAGAIAAYKRAMALDPQAADIPAELADLYLQSNKIQDAKSTAEQAIAIEPNNRDANRVLGIVYAAMSDTDRQAAPRARGSAKPDENVAKAIHHLELAVDPPVGADPNARATLARLYLRAESYDKAIPLLADLVAQESGWQDGPMLLAEAYAGAGRIGDGIAWLEMHAEDDPRLLPTLGDFYERERRWPDAAKTYAVALQRAPRNNALKVRYASALLNAGGRDNLGKARDALTEVVAARTPPDTQALYLLSQAHRRLGDSPAAEAAARRVIAQNDKSPWGYFALAEALDMRHAYQTVVDDLAPVIAEHRKEALAPDADEDTFDIGLLLPHVGFAYQELGQYDKAIASFEDARTLAPKDPSIAGYLIEANIAAKKYGAAIDLAKAALVDHPDDLGLTRLQAQALRQSGKADQGIALLEAAVKTHADEPMAYIALAQLYSDATRGAQAVKVLQDAQAKFPQDNAIAFELGSVFDKQKKFAESEAAFRQVLAREPDNAAALNYIGYMLAERGERLDESVNYLKKALQIDPDNGSYLDSLGWAYFKSDKLDLAVTNLRRAADQLRMNSVIQAHYGEVLFKLGRYDEAIAAWNRALTGDGTDLDRSDVDKKIRAAKQKLNKK
ncbi:MAG: tetratricopeptide repeat protein [Acidobacteriia bacterium]|nr:tetratricopeptide repeat protein [Terriglobia bacterium]